VPVLAARVMQLVHLWVRIRSHGSDWQRGRPRTGGQRYIVAFWHRYLVLMPWIYEGGHVCCLISSSRDGERLTRVSRLLGRGIVPARGSSSRGGASGLREMVRHARAGWDLGITPDGPRGPLRVVQPGVVLAAAATGLPVVPVAWAATRCWQLRSWDRFVIPKPFARVEAVHGEPLWFGRGEDPEAARARLQAALEAVEAEAERRVGRG
jgi:lysophospholipid acyltransferase (LPLAT)-like uncharacterized protein